MVINGCSVRPRADRAVERARREPVDRGCRSEPRGRRHADHLQVLRLGGDVVRLGSGQLRAAAGEPRLRLGDVGARDLAGGEAVAGLPQRHFQHVHVAALKLEDRGGLQQIHIGGGGVEQGVLFGRAQHLAGREHLTLGLARAVGSLKAVEQGLGGGDAERGHRNRALLLNVEGGAVRGGPRFREVVQILVGQARGAGHPRAIPRERGGNVLVNGAGCRALGIELRVVAVRLDERAVDRPGAGSSAHEAAVGRPGGAGVGGKRRGRIDRARGKSCNPRSPRNRPSPPRPQQHADLFDPPRPTQRGIILPIIDGNSVAIAQHTCTR